jgi:hypothetical protein
MWFSRDNKDNNRDWLEDYKYNNGNYFNVCRVCELDFMGHKRRVFCKVCQVKLDRENKLNCLGIK